MGPRNAERLALLQGVFYVATGLWPIVHLRSFEAITGPKLEGWLVKTVGVMITTIGLSMLCAARQRSVGAPTIILGTSSAAALAAVDIWYAAVRRRISPIYLADALVELWLLGGWRVAR